MNAYNIFHHVYWDIRIVLDLFLGSIGIGAFIIANILDLFFKSDKNKGIIKTAAVLAPISFGLGLIFMLLELGRPFRLLNTFLNFNVNSPMSWGGILQSGFMVIAIIYAAFWLYQKENNILTKLVGIIGLPVALGISYYHGALLYVVDTNAVWHQWPVLVTAILALIIAGLGALTLLSGEEKSNLLVVNSASKIILILALALQLIVILIWNFSGILLTNGLSILLWLGVVVIGLVLPLYLLIIKKNDLNPIILSILVLLGSFFTRYVILITGQI